MPEDPAGVHVRSAITRLLEAYRPDDHASAERLFTAVYPEVRALARSFMKRERQGHVLQATALAHEVYLKLLDQETTWKGRAHFFGIVATTIRRVLVDHARQAIAIKRGGGRRRVTLTGAFAPGGEPIDLLALEDAMVALARLSPRQTRVIELRLFGGLTIEETARILDVSPGTVKNDWRVGAAWIGKELVGKDPP